MRRTVLVFIICTSLFFALNSSVAQEDNFPPPPSLEVSVPKGSAPPPIPGGTTPPPIPGGTAPPPIPGGTTPPPIPGGTAPPPIPGGTALPPIPGGTAPPPIPGGTAPPPIPGGTALPPIPGGTALPPIPGGTALPPIPGGTAPPPTVEDLSWEQGLLLLLQPFNYDGEGRRDPFEPYKEMTAPSESSKMGPVLPLAKWDVDEIQLVAVRLNSQSPRAMFVTPDNRKFTLGKGERIGRNNGYIGAIRAEEVIVIEPVTVRGESHLVTRIIRLRN